MLQEPSTRALEDTIALECRNALGLGSERIQNSSVKWRTLGDVCGVERGDSVNVGIRETFQERVLQPPAELPIGGHVQRGEGEERAFVVTVACYIGNSCNLPFLDELIGRIGDESAIRAWEVRKAEGLVVKYTWGLVDGGLQFVVGDGAEASKGVCSGSAASVADDKVIVALAVLNGSNGDGCARLHEGTTE